MYDKIGVEVDKPYYLSCLDEAICGSGETRKL